MFTNVLSQQYNSPGNVGCLIVKDCRKTISKAEARIILAYVKLGHTKRVATTLNVSVRTVENHVYRIKEKFPWNGSFYKGVIFARLAKQISSEPSINLVTTLDTSLLTKAERDVVQLLKSLGTFEAVSLARQSSILTVRAHVKSVTVKLGVENLFQLGVAIEKGSMDVVDINITTEEVLVYDFKQGVANDLYFNLRGKGN